MSISLGRGAYGLRILRLCGPEQTVAMQLAAYGCSSYNTVVIGYAVLIASLRVRFCQVSALPLSVGPNPTMSSNGKIVRFRQLQFLLSF